MQTRTLRIPTDRGAALAARLDAPETPPRAYALFAHCFACGKDAPAATAVARALASHGIATVRFDFMGLGESEGDFAHTRFAANVEDLVAVAAWMRAELAAPALLVGHSLGGAAVLAAAHRLPEVVGVATIAAPFEPAYLTHLFADQVPAVEARGVAEVRIGDRNILIEKGFLDELAADDPTRRVRTLGRALLILHSPIDQAISVDQARRLFEAAKHPKSFLSLDDADHLLSRPADAEYAAGVIAAWAARYLPPPPPAPAVAGEAHVVVWETRRSRYQQVVASGPHRFFADEPAHAGGEDTGPNPYDLLLAALGACTSMTLRMYAERKQLPLEQVTVRLTHRKQSAAECPDCETRAGTVDVIDRTIELRGALDADQRASLLRIADRCPVHRTLHSEIKVRTTEA
ncbi:MAG: OsmC family protein [Myxococcales bacterium]|nr:OsmC family protein [Myxococcales bacterium]